MLVVLHEVERRAPRLFLSRLNRAIAREEHFDDDDDDDETRRGGARAKCAAWMQLTVDVKCN